MSARFGDERAQLDDIGFGGAADWTERSLERITPRAPNPIGAAIALRRPLVLANVTPAGC